MNFNNNVWDSMGSLISVLSEHGRIADFLESRDYNFKQRTWHDLPESYQLLYPLKSVPDIMARGSWFLRETKRYQLHPAIKLAVENTRPADWHLLVLEYPHVSERDRSRVAYTRSQEHGKADRQTVTSLGKYLSRHFPSMPQPVLRDIVMRFGADTFEIRNDVNGMVDAVQNGPKSCMQWDDDDIDNDYDNHPYAAYDPELGWAMAVRKEGHTISGRCLVNNRDKTFVRSYSRNDGGYSHSDEGLEVWLRDQGYSKAEGWHGHKLRCIEDGYAVKGDFLAPYLDGEPKQVERSGKYLVVVNNGQYLLNNTNGEPEECDTCECECCGDSMDEDDSTYVEDVGTVCQSCINNEYCYAVGRYGDNSYVHRENAVYVESNDTWYDIYHLERNGIVELHDGEYEQRDNAVYLDYREIWVLRDDERVIFCEDSGNYEHIDDCVQLHDDDWALEMDCVLCVVTDKWYLANDPAITDVGCVIAQDTFKVSEDGIEQDYSATYETETEEA